MQPPLAIPAPPASPIVPAAQFRAKASLLPVVLVAAVLYIGRDFFIPIAVATLISFLLAPLVRRLERWHFGRIAAVLTVSLLAFALIGGIGVLLGGQMIDLANRLPEYRTNLHEKIVSFRSPRKGALSRAAETIKDLTRELANPANETPSIDPKSGQQRLPAPAGQPAETVRESSPAAPMPVAIVETTGNAFQTLQSFIAPVLGPLGTAALVVIFVIFILLEREDLRDRLIHLVGQGRLRLTTQALDEATSRVSRYLAAQLIVNVTYGIPIGVGLWFIGVPNSFMWGLLATILRFVPYLGPWVAAAFPLALSLAVSKGWAMPLETVGLFLIIELISNNAVEPWLYGASTGLSPVAIIAAAAFWTWLWGTMGLLLATPLTVCLAVLGKYIPSLTFLDVLLGDKPPISPEARFYQRLLAKDEDEVTEIVEQYEARHSLVETFDQLLVPAMRLADEDFHGGLLDDVSRDRIYEIVRNLVVDLKAEPAAAPASAEKPVAICIPASDYADELIGLMLARLLAQSGQTLQLTPSKYLASEMMEAVSAAPTRLICVSVLPPGSTRHAIYVVKRLRERFPEARLLVGMWGETPGDDRRLQRFRQVKVDSLVISLAEMLRDIQATGRVNAPTLGPAALPPVPALTS